MFDSFSMQSGVQQLDEACGSLQTPLTVYTQDFNFKMRVAKPQRNADDPEG